MILKKNPYKKRCITHIFISNSVGKGSNLGQVFWLFPIVFAERLKW